MLERTPKKPFLERARRPCWRRRCVSPCPMRPLQAAPRAAALLARPGRCQQRCSRARSARPTPATAHTTHAATAQTFSLRSNTLQHTQHTQHTFFSGEAAGVARPGHTRAHTSTTAGAASDTAGSGTHSSCDEGMDDTLAAAAAAATAAHAARLTAPLTVGSRSIDSRRLSRRAGAAWHSMARCSPAQHSMAQPQQPWQPQRSAQLGSARHGGWREAGLPARVWPSTAPLGPPRVAQPRLRRL